MKNRLTRFIAALLVSATHSVLVSAIVFEPGDLDTFFGSGNGQVITSFKSQVGFVNPRASASAMAVQADGKIVLAGGCVGGVGFSGFCLARYAASGVLDTSFGSAGQVITAMLGATDRATAIAIQPDGKLIAAGYCIEGSLRAQLCFARYLANGTLDLSLSRDGTGKVFAPIGSAGAFISALALQPDGKIVLGGACRDGSGRVVFCVTRFSAGTLDTSFNGTGSVFTAVGGDTAADEISGIAVQTDGKIVASGRCALIQGGLSTFCAVRYLANGTLDTPFGGANVGKAIIPFNSNALGGDSNSAVLIQPNGNIVMTGSCVVPDSSGSLGFCAVRLTPNGSLDRSFNGSGKLTTRLRASGADVSTAITQQPDGKLLLGGSCAAMCFARVNADGTLDSSMGVASTNSTPGSVISPFAASAASAIAQQSDGKILLGGYCPNPITGNNNFCVTRFIGGGAAPGCSLDLDGDGLVLPTTDLLIASRIASGMNTAAALNGITFPAAATRKTWPLIRDYLVTKCGVALPPP